ncbi:hypothetical protein [Streptococcus danieliae]|uniref:Uncharacterized protein n=1 Tax=Streptococcus danieliae TaxID=747656 RepID=A0A7Z0S465_9STRE|nr:hypothetical protein [Streptococcus danieliae]MBF0699036.1 hypothetical protein [Streptococcus danieliae]NYS96213.1 hypothetical protein [Streptococcus danieliae]
MFKPKRETDGKYEYVSPGNAINYSETKNITFSFDDGDGTRKYMVGFSSYEHKQQILISYSLSQNLEIVSIYKYTPDDITEQKPSPKDQAMVDRYVKKLTDHVLETRVTPPLFNLQWLYDLTFDEKKVLHLEDD